MAEITLRSITQENWVECIGLKPTAEQRAGHFVADNTLSLAQASANFGVNFAIASPPGYSFSEEAMSEIGEIAERNGGSLEAYENPETAVQGADVVYTDTWVSMGQEAETEQREAALRPYQVNDELVRRAGTNAIVMHCLPAHRGHEITDSVADGVQSAIFQQAENRMHIQKAILATLMR